MIRHMTALNSVSDGIYICMGKRKKVKDIDHFTYSLYQRTVHFTKAELAYELVSYKTMVDLS